MRLPRLIPLGRSRRLFGALHLLSIAALLALWQLKLPFLFSLVLAIVLVFSLRRSLRMSPIKALRLGVRGDLLCVLGDGRQLPAELLPGTTVLASWVLLKLRGEGLPGSLLLLADSVTQQDDFRVLRVWLRGRANVGRKTSVGVE